MLLFTKKENTAMPATSWRDEFPDKPHFFGERLDAARNYSTQYNQSHGQDSSYTNQIF
jgi:hypothetical protein